MGVEEEVVVVLVVYSVMSYQPPSNFLVADDAGSI
jgi:hypothetical protein